ncbi:MAG: DNA polymerase I [Flavobacteriales bacterium]|nr:DNA polymerase I [Flavobacteriales bacterium]MDW8431267.1 DNA polymerase I [Flavobacteriales bacterium]
MNKLFLLDGYALLYRSYYAFIKNPRITTKGLNTSAIFGFSNTLLDILEKQQPSHLAVLFDPPEEKSDRGLLFEQYKAHRDPMPEDLKSSIPYVFELLDAARIAWFMLDGFEADDLIATLVRKFSAPDTEIFIATLDKDLAQLVGAGVFWYKLGRMSAPDEILDAQAVCQKFDIEHPSRVVDLIALMGDTSDNIPGVPGIGEKTALKLLKEFGSLENILKNTHKLEGKLKEKIEQGKALAELSFLLATVKSDAPLQVSLEQMKIKEPDVPHLKELFQKLEFRQIAKRWLPMEDDVRSQTLQLSLFEEKGPTAPPLFSTSATTPHQYKIVGSSEELERFVEQLMNQKAVCLDTETDALNSQEAHLVGIAFSWKAHEAYFIPISESPSERQAQLEKLRPFFQAPQVRKVAHNLKFDMAVLRNHGLEMAPPWEDTLLMHYILDPEARHSMDFLAKALLNYEPIAIETLIGPKGPNQASMRQVPLEKLAEYAAEDADVTFQLWLALRGQLEEKGGVPVYEKIELPLVPVLEDMERTGVAVDTRYLASLSEDFTKEAHILEKEIFDLAGTSFNISSPKQLGEILFDRLKLDPKAKRTGKTKQYATSEDVLEGLAGRHPIVVKVLEYREIQKLKSTYVEALPEMVNPRTGRIHTSFNQTITATGRLSSNNPNLQNIPIRTPRGQAIRKAIVASRPDYRLLSVDYSQVELRIIASLSEEENMIRAFLEGQDIHAATAARLFGVPLEKVSKDMRSKAKMVNFGIIYGITPFGLAQRTGLSRTEAGAIIDQYFHQYPRIRTYMDRQIALAREKGYVETLFGRRRYLRDIHSANPTVRGFAERNAINAPIQGTAADIIKLAMIQVHQKLKEKKLKTQLVLQVHDELVLDGPESEMEEVQPLVQHLMETACSLRVPLATESGVGRNWLEAH